MNAATAAAVLVAGALAATTAHAMVTDVGANGFTLTESVHVAAPPERVYAAFIAPQQWWSSVHSFSGNARNFTLEPKAGGCWCETLPNGGSVLHMTVVNVAPGKLVRLRGALGPFQGLAVDGALSVTFVPGTGGTDVTMVYALGGYARAGFGDLSKAADRVLEEQLLRLKALVETGSAETPQPPTSK